MTDAKKAWNENLKNLFGGCGSIEVWRAIQLVDMAVRGERPDESFSKLECDIWDQFNFIAEYNDGPVHNKC